MPAVFTLSAFGDEITADLASQLDVLASEGVYHLELRGAWGQHVLELDPAQLRRARALLAERGFAVSAIGSPIGKSGLERPRAFELERLARAIAAAEALGTRRIRVFSFYVPSGQAEACHGEVLERMAALVERAEQAGVLLLHENDQAIYGDVPARCRLLLQEIDSPALRMAFDPANFVQAGVRPMDEAWPLLATYTAHVHIKDAVFADGSVRPAGQGDAAIPELLAALITRSYHGFLTVEPHLTAVDHSGNVSGEGGMRGAIQALRSLLAALPGAVTVR